MMILMAKVDVYSRVLLVSAVIALFLGAIVVAWTATGWRVIAGTNMHVLTTRYDPDGRSHDPARRTYDDLYRLTTHIAEQHNDFARRFFYTLGLAFLAVGMTLLAWSIGNACAAR